jgi:hypothetical protein
MPNLLGGSARSERDLAFSVKFNVADSPDTVLDFTRFFQSAKAEVSDMGSYHVIIELFDGEGSDLESSLVMAGQNSALTLSFGWKEDSNPVMELSVVSFSPKFLPDGFGTSINCVVEHSYEAGTNKLPANTFSFPGYKYTASQMVSHIAAKEIVVPAKQSSNGTPTKLLTNNVIKTVWKDPIIEESSGIIEADLATELNDTTCGFILKKIMPLAVNREGKPFDFYFDQSGVMHFHSKGYDSSSTNDNREAIVASYEYARDSAGDVFQFEPEYSGVGAAMLGGSAAVYKSVNSVDGSTTTVTTSPSSNGVSLDISVQSDAKNVMPVSAGTQSYTTLQDRTPGDAALRAQAVYGYLRSAYVTATLTVLGNWSLKMGQLVEVRYRRRDGTNHPMGGLFRISRLAHTIDSSRGFMTGCNLFKEGIGDTLPGLVNLPGVTQATSDLGTPTNDDSTTITKQVS